MRRDEILYRRTIESRSNQVRVLSSEEQFWSDRLAELEKRMASDACVEQWQKILAELPTKATALEQQIQTDETLLIEQRSLRQNLTPRSVEQGWLEQDVGLAQRVFVGVNVSEKREQVGQKLEALGQREGRREVEDTPCQRVQHLVDRARTGLLAEVRRIRAQIAQ